MKPVLVYSLLMSTVTLLSDVVVVGDDGEGHASRVVVIKSNAVTRVRRSNFAVHLDRRRHRRHTQQPLTPNQMSEITDRHNVLRAAEGADNMELVVKSSAHAYSGTYIYNYCISIALLMLSSL